MIHARLHGVLMIRSVFRLRRTLSSKHSCKSHLEPGKAVRKVGSVMAREGGEMTVREAGRLGGDKRKESLGASGYSQLGKKGGQTTKARHGREFYAAIGKMGGEVVRRERGSDYFSEIGKKGGGRVKELIEKGKRAA